MLSKRRKGSGGKRLWAASLRSAAAGRGRCRRCGPGGFASILPRQLSDGIFQQPRSPRARSHNLGRRPAVALWQTRPPRQASLLITFCERCDVSSAQHRLPPTPRVAVTSVPRPPPLATPLRPVKQVCKGSRPLAKDSQPEVEGASRLAGAAACLPACLPACLVLPRAAMLPLPPSSLQKRSLWNGKKPAVWSGMWRHLPMMRPFWLRTECPRCCLRW